MSDDNAYVESLFRTAKYRPEFPAQGFADREAARHWGAEFVRWYNVEHRHSGIRYVSPAQRHAGHDVTILAARRAHPPLALAGHGHHDEPSEQEGHGDQPHPAEHEAHGHDVHGQARQRHPARWSGNTRDWSPITVVTLNPERDATVAQDLKRQDSQPMAA